MGFLRVLPLIFGVFSLLSIAAERIDRGLNGSLEIGMNDNNVSSTFLDQDQRYWYEHLDDADRMLKYKADILSRLFKMHIDRLRNKTDQVDLK